MSQFEVDKEKARKGEELVLEVLKRQFPTHSFTLVSTNPCYYDKGDILADGCFIEVKTDSRFAQTRNILCEDEVYDKRSGILYKGNMHSQYEYYAILSEKENAIYFFDFSALKRIYKQGEFKRIEHPTQYTDAFLVPLWMAKREGALLARLEYGEEEKL